MNPCKYDFKRAYSIVRSIYKEQAHPNAWRSIGLLLHKLTDDCFPNSSKLRFCQMLANATKAYNAERYQAHDNYTHVSPGEIKLHDPLSPVIKYAYNDWRKARGLKPVKWKSEPCESEAGK